MAIELDGLLGITSDGNVTTGNFFIGNGYYLTNVQAVSSYNDANVNALLASGTVPLVNVVDVETQALQTIDITALGNVTALSFIGDGSQLTGLPAGYTDANVATLLASGNVTTDIITTANISGNNLSVTSNAVLGNIYSDNFFYANGVPFTSGSSGVIIGDQQITGDGNTTYTLDQAATTQSIIVTLNGVTQTPTTAYTVAGNTITFASAVSNANVIDIRYFAASGGNVDIYGDANVALFMPTYSGNLGSANTTPVTAIFTDGYYYANGAPFVGGGAGNYGNSNVTNFLNAGLFTGDFIPAGNATQDLGSSTNQWKDLWLSGNTLYMTQVPISLAGNTLQVDGANVVTSDTNGNVDLVGNVNAAGMTITGNAIITGNANIQGTLTYNNISSITTDNLIVGLGNNQSGINVTDAGIVVGSTAEAQFLYNQPAQTWDSNIGIDAAGNITAPYFIGDGSQLTGLPASYGNSNVTTLLSDGTVTSNVVTTGNIAGNYILGDGTFLTNVIATTSIVNGTSNARVYANGNVTISSANVANVVTVTGNSLRVAGNIFDSTGQVYSVAASFAKYTRTTTQTGVTANTPVVFNVLESQFGTDIAVNTTTGSFTLQPGKTYRLRGTVGFCNNTSATGAMTYQWFNVTSGVWVGQGGGLISVDGTGLGDAWQSGTAEYVFTATVTTVVQLRVVGVNNSSIILSQTGASNISNWKIGSPFADIQVIGGAAPVTTGEPVWTSGGTIQTVGWGATTTAPTPASSATKNNLSYKQIGAKIWQVQGIYEQPNGTGATAGSGDYLFTLPLGLQFDTTLPYQATYQLNIGTNSAEFPGKTIPTSDAFLTNNSSNSGTTQAGIIPWDATRYRVFLPIAGSGFLCWGSGFFPPSVGILRVNWTMTFQSV